MTNYRENTKPDSSTFINIAETQLRIVIPNETTNRIENSSFESPIYNSNLGYLEQYNWHYNVGASVQPYPVTFHHAYSGSFAWKAKVTSSAAVISYGKTRAIQPTKVNEYHDVLSFYCYCVEDAVTHNYDTTVASHEHTFSLKIYGVNRQNVIADNANTFLVSTYDFTLTSLPKNNIGDLSNGVSGSKTPHFYPWTRVVFRIPPEGLRNFGYFFFTINKKESNPESGTTFLYDTYFVIDAVQLEKQPTSKSATLYFDGSYESFNTRKYPYDFQWAGEPYRSMSIRSANTRVSGEDVDVNDYCNFYLQDIQGVETPNQETSLFGRSLKDGQIFVDQSIQNQPIVLKGRIVASSEATFMESFNRFQELVGKRPFAAPEPVRLIFTLKFTNGTKLLPVYVDVAYQSGLEMETANEFQSDVEITFDVISTHLQYQNDSAVNVFNDSPTFDQFNTMEVDILRDVGGLLYYNKDEEKWTTPGGIGVFRLTDVSYTSNLPYNGVGINQKYDTKSHYRVGDVHVIKEDSEGIIWFGGRFDIVEFDAYYIDGNSERQDVRLQTRVNNVFGIRNRAMSGLAYVLPSIAGANISSRENGPSLIEVEFVSEWQIVTLLDAPTRYSLSQEQNPDAFIGIPGNSSIVYAIEFTPNNDMYVGGRFDFTFGGRRFVNIARFRPHGSDAQNVSLYKPETLYDWISRNLNTTTLESRQGRGLYRTNWVNSAIPYAKYGIFEDIGVIGAGVGDTVSRVNDIAYDAFNECLYIGGTFVVVSNQRTPYNFFDARRIVKFSIFHNNFVPINDGVNSAGIQPNSTSADANVFVKKILVQYTPSGSRIFACGKFTTVGRNSSPLNSYGIAIITCTVNNSNVFTYRDTGGGGFKAGTPNDSAIFYDAIITKDEKVYVAGDFNRLNRNTTPYVRITGIAEYRYNNFVDVTRGMEADYYEDTYEEFPAVRSLASNSIGEVYIVGNFTNIKNRQFIDSIAKWNGEEFVGAGIYFLPQLSKILQKVFVDQADNVFVFTGPNSEKTTIVRTLFTDTLTFIPPANIDIVWQNFPYSVLQSVFKANSLHMEFYSYKVVGNKKTRIAGQVNATCTVGPRTNSLRGFANFETVFIGGKFDYIKIGDTEFRVNNLVALRFDENQNPFPFKVLVFANGRSPYYDNGSQGEDLPYFGINLTDRLGVTDSQIFSIDVVTENAVPRRLYIGGRFDTIGRGYEADGDTVKKTRFKNFIAIDLELNALGSDLQFNVPENYEQNISVPYMNYTNYRAPGLAGTSGVNDAVFVVRATSGGFLNGVTRTDPGLVFLGGSFTELYNGSSSIPARRIGVFTRNNSYLANRNQFYKIDFTQDSTPKGAQVGTTYSDSVYVKTLEYTPWRTVVTNTFDTTLIVGGRWRNNVSPFEAGAGTSVSTGTGSGLLKLGIVNAAKNQPQVEYNMDSLNIEYVQDSTFDDGLNVFMVGDFEKTFSGTRQYFIIQVTGSTSSDNVTFGVVASSNWPNIYESRTGLPFVPEFIQRQVLTGALCMTGIVGVNEATNLFIDKTALKYNTDSVMYAANYSYGSVNVPQVSIETSGTVTSIESPPRRLLQAPSLSVGRAIDIRRSNIGLNYTISIPYEDYNNTLFDAAIMQTFNAYNNGTASVYPTISLYTPFKPNSQIVPFIQVITNVTTQQSIYLNLWMQANELVRIRTEKNRISVISSIRGDITNVIFNVRNSSLSSLDGPQMLRLIPGKNVIRYGPSFPMQRYFSTGFTLSRVDYNLNRNVVVAPIVVSLSWPISFNSIYDALYTEVNPLIL
jgi:hypothetical protein